ncbi:MAG TPA: hypothetical protein VI704_01205 [Bacteroidota bacterium]|nr:hypothetical protein [Bacteroidota bacterium]
MRFGNFTRKYSPWSQVWKPILMTITSGLSAKEFAPFANRPLTKCAANGKRLNVPSTGIIR